MPASVKPHSITIHCYNVGFGDCFLVTFHYKTSTNDERDRHVLIDFGSTSAPEAFAKDKNLMVKIAQDIAHKCGGKKLDAVVATHRHKDHISGFATAKNGKSSGDVIRALNPDVVIQPWTEDPDAEPDALVPVNAPGKAVQNFVGALRNMHSVAQTAFDIGMSGTRGYSKALKNQLSFLGGNNLANRSAIENLMTIGKKRMYVHFGSKTGLEKVLPGVTTQVLGPPTLRQTETIRRQASRNKDEFWHFSQFWGFQALAAGRPSTAKVLFPRAETKSIRSAPPEIRWFLDHARSVRGELLLGIVRALDKAMNNTSVVVLFETGSKRLLFPGDAQLENWSFALQRLKDEGKLKSLEEVDLYKVGHHGSLNATPKSLWRMLKKRGPVSKKNRLQSIMSTKPGKHGSVASGTEVPRKKLVDALESDSTHFSTHTMKKKDGLAHTVTLRLS